MIEKLNVFGSGIIEKGVAYPLIRSNGHFIADIHGEKFVIDTGCPVTMRFSLTEGLAGMAGGLVNMTGFSNMRGNISTLCGCDVDGIIGTNMMKENGNFLIDIKNSTVTFGAECSDGNADRIPFDCDLRALTAEIEVDGRKHRTILDSGAKVNYIHRRLLPENAEFVRKDRDYHPQLGWYGVDIYSVPVTLAGRERTIEFAIMTPGVEKMTMVCGAQIIIGFNELGNKFIFADFQNNTVTAG